MVAALESSRSFAGTARVEVSRKQSKSTIEVPMLSVIRVILTMLPKIDRRLAAASSDLEGPH